MQQEQNELYHYTKDKFMSDLKGISPTCIGTEILRRRVIKKAIYKYVENYCSPEKEATDIFTNEDFYAVSHIICNEIIEGKL